MKGASLVGTRVELECVRFAHGGYAVARDGSGRVVFVRHALPAETVLAQVTRGGERDRFLFADAVQVLAASPHRVTPPCPYAGPGRCGGCDLQHADLEYQRGLKAAVVREQLSRLAGIETDVLVQPVSGDTDGLRWRTRVEFAVDGSGRPGLRPFHTRAVLPVDDCLIARREILDTGVLDGSWPGQRAVDVVAPSVGEAVLVPVPSDATDRRGERGRDGRRGGSGAGAGRGASRRGRRGRSGDRGASTPPAPEVRERVEVPGWSGELAVDARGFWQVHPGAAATFLAHVLAQLKPRPGESALDLYAGVGLFARALADAVGPAGRVVAVEAEGRAVELGQRDTASTPQLSWRVGRVERELELLPAAREPVDLVVLDPPRAGAGAQVMTQLTAMSPRAIAYVACDPAALARDLGALRGTGYELDSLAAFDAFPMTHHVECIAICRPVRD